MSEDVLEEDIWDYKSIRRPKVPNTDPSKLTEKVAKPKQKQGQKPQLRTSSSKKNKGNCNSQTASQNLPASNSLKEDISPQSEACIITPGKNNELSQISDGTQTPRNARPICDGQCPICQMPFSILLVQTPRWHVSECLEMPGCSENECPDGLQCTSTIPSHYKRYTHLLLAESRAWGDLVDFQPASPDRVENGLCTTVSGPTDDRYYQEELQSPPQSSEKQNALLLLKSGAKQCSSKAKLPKGISKQGYSPKAVKLDTKRPQGNILLTDSQRENSQFDDSEILPSQKTQTGGSVDYKKSPDNLPLLEMDLSDGDISYSPLCSDDELPDGKTRNPRKKLFFCRESEEENSEDEGTLSSFNKLDPAQQERNDHNSTKAARFKKQHQISSQCNRKTTNKAFHAGLTCAAAAGTEKARLATLTKSSFSVECGKVKQEPYELQPVSADCDKVELLGAAAANVTTQTSSSSSDTTRLLNIKQETSSSLQSPQSVVLEELRDYLVKREEVVYSSTNSSDSQLYSSQALICLPSDSQKENNTSLGSTNISSDFLHQSSQMASRRLSSSSLAKTMNKPPASKGLKQMDIGVFFGLKPKVAKEQEKQASLKQQTATPNDGNPEVKPSGGRSGQRKRKAEGSVGDTETVTDGAYNNGKHIAHNGQQRWIKRFKGGAATNSEERAANKQCPFYKKIPGTRFVVDAFQYGEIPGCIAYFLTHFHADHYGGLTKNFRFPIYCSTVTGNLVKSKLRVQEQYMNALPMDTECMVDGIKVVLLEANHCPGAAMLLFLLPNGTTVLHTGDFRADPSMERCPALKQRKINTLYLDTTYCSPEYTFPPQEEVIQFAVNVAFETVTLNPRTLVVCGTYSIGKEKVFLAVAGILGCKVSMSRDKYNTLRCLESEAVNSLITMDWNCTSLHLLPMMQINCKSLQAHLSKFSNKYDQVLAFKPTGWTYSDRCDSMADIKPQVRGRITIYGIPYSEHSSYLEMKRFVQWLRPDKIIPTVNVGSWKSRKAMEKCFSEWRA